MQFEKEKSGLFFVRNSVFVLDKMPQEGYTNPSFSKIFFTNLSCFGS